LSDLRSKIGLWRWHTRLIDKYEQDIRFLGHDCFLLISMFNLKLQRINGESMGSKNQWG